MFTIDDIIETLNGIEVKGKENLDRLLGAILALEAVKKAQDNQAKAEAETEETTDGR